MRQGPGIVPRMIVAAWATIAFGQNTSWDDLDRDLAAGATLPALNRLPALLDSAHTSGDAVLIARATALGIALSAHAHRVDPANAIANLEIACGDATDGCRPILHAVLGNWYRVYLATHADRIAPRLPPATDPGPDIRGWDEPRLLSRIATAYAEALAAAPALQAVPVAPFASVLNGSCVTDSPASNLLEFVLHDLLSLHTGRAYGAPADVAIHAPPASGPLLGSADEFIRWDSRPLGTNTPLQNAVAILQRLMSLHREQSNHVALAELDRFRIQFASTQVRGPEIGRASCRERV